MDLVLSEDQRLFLTTTRKFLASQWSLSTVREHLDDPGVFDRGVLGRGADLGWTSMLVPEECGGGTISGEGVRDLGLVAEELGASLISGPILQTNLVAFALARSGASQLAKEHLPRLGAGQEIASWALAEPSDSWRAEDGAVKATRIESGFRLEGVKTPVQDAQAVDYLLVTAVDGSTVTELLVDVNAPGVTITALAGLDLTRRYCRVRFDGVEVAESRVVGTPDAAERDLRFALLLALQCAETVGATDRLYAMTLQYVKDRKAFGRPIGSYQALKHRLAEMLLWLESAKAATDAALAAVESEHRALDAARQAKAYIADRCPAIVRDCLQMHGGIGFTWDHDLHLLLRRVETNAVISGGADHQLDRLPAVVRGVHRDAVRRTDGPGSGAGGRLEPAHLSDYRAQVRDWLGAHLNRLEGEDPDLIGDPAADRILEAKRIQSMLYEAGYAGFTFPVEYGGQGLTLEHERVFLDEAAGYDVPIRFFGVSINILGATLAAFGTHEQKTRHLRKILSGEQMWLQLLSEPSGGSDLAGLLMTAERQGDEFVVNGQKTWSTGAHFADFALCPVRTAWDVPKHRGISLLIVDLRSPGIEIRQIRQINGEAHFCEEFFTDVRVAASNLVGEQHQGWRVIRGLLEIEHAWVGRGGAKRVDFRQDVSDLVSLADKSGLAGDVGVRRSIAALGVGLEVQKLVAARVSQGIESGTLDHAHGSLLKMGNDHLSQRGSELGLAIGGANAVTWDGDGSAAEVWADAYLTSRSAPIAGGSAEILRNNVSEKVLGLPREPSVDRDVTFNQVPHN